MDSFETSTLDYRQWIGSTDAELGTALADTSKIHRYQAFNGQAFNVLEVDGRRGEGGPVIVGAASFDCRIDPLLTKRMGILAHHSGARVFMAELPGVTVDHADPFHTRGAWQTPMQTAMAAAGNFDMLAKKQLKAIDSIAHFQDGDEIQLFGQSMGAYSAASMARVLAKNSYRKQIVISKMTLVEPVNAWRNNNAIEHFKMVRNLIVNEDARRQVYLDENDLIGHPTAAYEQLTDETKRIHQHMRSRISQRMAAYAAGMGLRKSLYTVLSDVISDRDPGGTHLHEADITVARASSSTVSLDTDLLALSDAAHEQGVWLRLTEFEAGAGDPTPLGHHSADSLGRMADLALYMANR